MLSRTARLLFIAWSVLLVALLVHGATHAWPAGALIGLAVLLLGHPALMAVEFVLSQRTGLSAGSARAPAGTLLRAWLIEWALSTQVFGWLLPWRSRAIPDHLPPGARGRRGVVLVHGFLCNRGFWNPWLARLRRLDHPFAAVDLEPVFGHLDGYVDIVEAAVRRVEDATGLPPVVIAHSMGGLVTRAWLRHAAGNAARVAQVVTIATPHRGTWLAKMSTSVNATEMRMGGAWMTALAACEPADLGRRFTCWWSECDQIVFPPPTGVLPGSDARHLPGVAHIALARREEVWADLVARLGR